MMPPPAAAFDAADISLSALSLLLIHAIISRRFLSMLSSSPIISSLFRCHLFRFTLFMIRHYLRLRAAAATLMPLIATLLMMLIIDAACPPIRFRLLFRFRVFAMPPLCFFFRCYCFILRHIYAAILLLIILRFVADALLMIS